MPYIEFLIDHLVATIAEDIVVVLELTIEIFLCHILDLYTIINYT